MPTGSVYVGSSKTINTRFSQHKRDLRANKHCNPHLQNAWNKYGESAFFFKSLDFVGAEKLAAREQYFIDRAPRKFNVSLLVDPRRDAESAEIQIQGAFNYKEIPSDSSIFERFEKALNAGPVTAAKCLGCAYVTYAQYRAGSRELPLYHQRHMDLWIRNGGRVHTNWKRERLKQVLNGSI